MELLEVILLSGIIIVSVIWEELFFDIHPGIWAVGGILGLLYNIFLEGICVWYESLLALGILFFVINIVYSKIQNFIGEGILKGIYMCSIFYGRYIVLMITLTFFSFFLVGWVKYLRKPDILPGEEMMRATPFLLIATLMTSVILFVFL